MEAIPWISLIAVAALALTSVGRSVLGKMGRALARGSHRPLAGPAIVFAAALALGAAPTLLGHAPIPSVHDEFANLLAADTFLHGRLANSTPPLWEHFQTVHELMTPTYASKFPPGLGLMLALGNLLGCTALGAFGTVAIACAMVSIALNHFMPRHFAMLGGLLAATHPLIFWWGQSYWGGGVAMLGGALLLTGAGRAKRQADVKSGLSIGAGMTVLALSRPFEGLIVSLLLAAVVVWRCVRGGRTSLLFAHTFTGALVILLPAAMWMGYYNYRITGSWSRLPWVEYARQSMSTPIFWGPMPEPVNYRHDKLRQFHAGFERQEYERLSSAGYPRRLWWTTLEMLDHWLNPRCWVLFLPAVCAALWRWRAARTGGLVFAGLLVLHPALTPWMREQYLAPAAAGLCLLIAPAIRQSMRWQVFGQALAAGLIAAQVSATGMTIARIVNNDNPPGMARARLVAQVQRQPGRHLVLLKYTARTQLIFEWVYNDADIERSRIVFARSIDAESDRRLLAHFPQRTTWLLTIDGTTCDLARLSSVP